MKQKLIIAGAVLLLIALVVWMVADLLPGDQAPKKNPYDYGLSELRLIDSLPSYTEILPLRPSMEEILAIATDPGGKIFIAGKGGVQILSPAGRTLNRFSIPGLATCLAVMPDGNLAIGMEDHLEIWSPAGILIASWDPPDSLAMITSVAGTPDFVYLADAGKKVVHQYDRKGALLSQIGQKDPERKIPGFVIPSPFFDLGISPAGDLWVVNPGRHQFEKYMPDGSLAKSWGEASLRVEGFTGCCNPSHFTFLADGAFVTSEKGIERVKVYNPDGSFRCLVAGAEAFDEGTRGLDLAAGIDGRIFVLDPARNLVHVFLPHETQ